MHIFTDAAGREWSLVITIGTIRRVRELAGVDLMQIANGDLLQRLADPVLLADVLWAICKPQADAKGVAPDAFAEGLLGDAIEAATKAFLAEVIAFFPSQTRALLQRVLDAAETQQTAIIAVASARMDSMMKTIHGASSPSAPASSDSTPTA